MFLTKSLTSRTSSFKNCVNFEMKKVRAINKFKCS